jgi:putative endonuclease
VAFFVALKQVFQMTHFIYILYSPSTSGYYIGETAFLDERLNGHNEGKHQSSYTKRASDWELYLLINCKDRKEALKIEKKIKSMKSTQYITNVKQYPEIIEKLKAL